MLWINNERIITILMSAALLSGGAASAAVHVEGQVQAGGGQLANSTVTLWAGSSGDPQQLAQAKTGNDGSFSLDSPENIGADIILYLTAQGGTAKSGGDNPAVTWLSVLGNTPPAKTVINEMTTVAAVWTNAQFLNGAALKGHPLGLKIAAGNVPSFVDLQTGGWGTTIQDPLNSGQTPTMANFATLADLLSGCATRVTADACDKLFAAATDPRGNAPKDTLAAAESVASYPWYKPERLFVLLGQLYPVPPDKTMRAVPFMPYLSVAPSAWVLPLKFDGGGFRAGGKAMFDSEGNLWVGDNFTVGWQGQDVLWQGHATKFSPNGKPLSPITTGFTGGGMQGGTFGNAIDSHDNAWLSSYGGKSIAVFDKTGKPLSPPEGITLNGQLGLMQGIIATPNDDVWAVSISKNQVVYFPKGDPTKGKLICEGFKDEPCKSLLLPFHLGIDQQDRIWVTSKAGDSVARFPAADPSQVQTFKSGYGGGGLGIDSRGNVWITNSFGSSERGRETLEEFVKILKSGGNYDEYLSRTLLKQQGGPNGGSVSALRPDGSEMPGSPFTGAGLAGPFALVVDGNDNVWVSNFGGGPQDPITELCGARTETCPPGFKTGDPIAPPGGYVGGGLQMLTDIAISPAGDVWAMNNWQILDSCFPGAPETLSTLCGGQGVTVFFGMAKPVRAPQIGPARAY